MKIYFETYGCTMNQGDTEIMKGRVSGEHELVESVEECDVAVLNSCGVIERTERKITRRIEELCHKKVIIAGCLPRINLKAVEKADAIVSARNLNLNGAIDAVVRGKRFVDLSDVVLEKVCVPKKRSGTIAIVPISEGCLKKCSYCAAKLARGRLRSFGMDAIAREVKDAVMQGYKEIQLTAQDVAAYGIDAGKRLPELLHEICEIQGNFRVRVGMMNPEFSLELTEELIDCYRDEKIYKFLHVPVQSGDDKILKNMKRGYKAGDFFELVRRFRREMEGITLSTDVIVGYPGEDENSFLETYRLIEKIKPDILNIKKFSPRPRTPAAKLKDMPDRIKKERSRKLTALHKEIALEKNKQFTGKEFEVLITEVGKNNTLLARTNSYKQVVLGNGNLGEFLKVKIRDAMPGYLIANSNF